MNNNAGGRQSAHLEAFGGVVTLAQPHDLPEGASPRTVNTDITVGSVFTRQGLENIYTYQSGTVTHPASTAADVTVPDASPWIDPANVLLNTGVYASTVFVEGGTIASTGAVGTSAGGGTTWTYPGYISSGLSGSVVSQATSYTPTATSSGDATGSATGSDTGGTVAITVVYGVFQEATAEILWSNFHVPTLPSGATVTSVVPSVNLSVAPGLIGTSVDGDVFYNFPGITFPSGAFDGTYTGLNLYSGGDWTTIVSGYSCSIELVTSGGLQPATLGSIVAAGITLTISYTLPAPSVTLSGTGSPNHVAGGATVTSTATAVQPDPVPNSVTYTGAPNVSATAATVFATVSGTVVNQGTLSLFYSTNSGATWTEAYSWNSSITGDVAVPITITSISNTDTIQLQLVASAIYNSGVSSVTGSVVGWDIYTTTSEISQTLVAALDAISIPTDAVVKGLVVSFEASCTYESESNVTVWLSTPGSEVDKVNVTTSPTVYTLGSSTDLWGYKHWTASTLSSLDVNFIANYAHPFGGETSTFTLSNLLVTVYYSLPILESDDLNVTGFDFSIPSTAQPQGFEITVPAYTSAPGGTLYVQMLKDGVAVGAIRQISLPSTVTTITLGSFSDLFGESWSYADINNPNFGVQISAAATGSGDVYVGYVQLEVFFVPSPSNFNYVTTFEDSFGNIQTLALDANGQFWAENVNTNEGVLVPLFNGLPPNSFASSFTADSRQFIAISNLSEGTYPPQGYNKQWNDRVSQVGAGAPPAFAGTLSAGSPATITAYSTASGVVTLTAVNTFTAGEIVNITITAGPTFLNGAAGYNVLGTGLSGTQFQVAYAGASGSGSASGTATGQYTYPIVASPNGITQFPFWNQAQGYQSGFDAVTQTAGAGSTDAGNVITIYYLDAYNYQTGEDANLVKLFQQQLFPVYVYVSGVPLAAANGTFQVTNVGVGTPPGGSHERWYLTYNVPNTSKVLLGSGANSVPGTYQLTVATLNTTLPLPGVQTGDSVTLSGNTIGGWNATWNIVNALNSGSFSVSQTSINAGVATYYLTYTGSTSTPPVAGQLLTVTGCLNPAANFNVTDAAITSVSWSGATGTVTVAGFPGNITATTPVVEVGQATTSGSTFQIDPGALTLGSASGDPIYGNSGGGYITLVNASSVVGVGTRRGVVFFITRNGYYTAPSPYLTFNTVENTNYILASSIPIGPPNVIARVIAFTEAGQNDVPGSSYYTIPTPVQFTVGGTQYLSSSLYINDNVTTTAKFTFPDSVLLSAEEIDIQGNDLFALQELGDAAWCTQYAGRSVWGRVNNKIQNFLNLSFDGGYLPNAGGNLMPLGWGLDNGSNIPTSLPTLTVSPVFGNSYYIRNNTGSTASQLGMIIQSAYQDQNSVAILQNNTPYSVRVTCRTPSNTTAGSLVVDLTSYNVGSGYGQTYGSFTLNTSAMTSTMATYSGTLLANQNLTIPNSLYLRVWAQNLANNGDIEIDRVEIFPTLAPVNLTGLTFSYLNDWESFDAITGGNDTSTVNAQPANGAFTMHDKLYILKESSMGYLSDSPSQEPANWNPFREVSNIAGACGINAFDVGEEWAITACQNGLFAFFGGAPIPIQLEIPDIWSAINWKYGNTVVVRNDSNNRRIYIAAPIATPNQWMPTFEENVNPTTPDRKSTRLNSSH